MVRQEQDTPRDKASSAGDEPTAKAPSRSAAPGHIAAAQDELVAGVQRLDEPRQVLGCMAEVAVHLNDPHAVGVPQRLDEPSPIGRSEARLLLTVQDAHPLVSCGQRIRQHPRSVRRIVVHDEDLAVRHDLQHGIDERRNVVALVVGGHNDPCPGGGTL